MMLLIFHVSVKFKCLKSFYCFDMFLFNLLFLEYALIIQQGCIFSIQVEFLFPIRYFFSSINIITRDGNPPKKSADSCFLRIRYQQILRNRILIFSRIYHTEKLKPSQTKV